MFYFVLIGCCDYYQFVLVLRYSIEKRSKKLVIFLLLILRIDFAYLILRINFAYLICVLILHILFCKFNFAYLILHINFAFEHRELWWKQTHTYLASL